MPTWTELAPTTDYTVSGNVLTLAAAADETLTYVFYYSFDDAADSTGHAHHMEKRTGGWNSGTTWPLAHTPDGQESLLLRSGADLLLWVAYSTISDSRDLTVRLASVDSATGAFVSWQTAGVLCNASGAAGEEPRVLKCMGSDADSPVFLATQNGADVRVYRVEGASIISTWSRTCGATAEPTSLYVEEDGTIWLTISCQNQGVDDGVWRSTDGGANFTRQGDGHLAAYKNDFGGGFHGTIGCVLVDEVRRRVWTSHGPLQDATNSLVISYSDDEGVTWTDLIVTTNTFADGRAGNLTGYPYRDGDRVSMSFQAFIGGNTGMGYITAAATVTMLTEFGSGSGLPADNTAEMAFFDDPDDRIITPITGASAGKIYTSGDAGDSWMVREDWNSLIRQRGISIHVERHFVAAAFLSLAEVAVSIDRGVTFDTWSIPNRAQLVTWVEGF